MCKLHLIIDSRYTARRSTLIISNRQQHEMVDRLGEPVFDRLSGQGILLAFDWHSYRQPQGNVLC